MPWSGKAKQDDCWGARMLSWAMIVCMVLACFAVSPRPARGEEQTPENGAVLVEVDGRPVFEAELRQRLAGIHRAAPRLRAEGRNEAVSVREVLDDLVDERLFVREAEALELDRDEDFVRRLNDFVSQMAVLRLWQTEVVGKAEVGDKEIEAYYREQVLPRLEKHATETESEVPSVEVGLAHYGERIARKLRKQKEQELARAFMDGLRAGAKIVTYPDLAVQAVSGGDVGPLAAVAKIDDVSVTVAAFREEWAWGRKASAMGRGGVEDETMQPDEDKVRAVLDRLVECELAALEAERRNYPKQADFAGMVDRKREEMLLARFLKTRIEPLSRPDARDLEQCYKAHPERFKAGREWWFSQMRFRTAAEAEDVLRELRQGADFEYLAERHSDRRQARVWIREEQCAPAVRQALSDMDPGQVSDVVQDGRQFALLRLNGCRGGALLPMGEVAPRLKAMAAREKHDRVVRTYLDRLRADARIVVHEKALREVEARCWAPRDEGEAASGNMPGGAPGGGMAHAGMGMGMGGMPGGRP